MIKNIIFDLGNVVFRLKFENVIKNFTQNEDEIKLLKSVIFDSEEWLKLDEGTISKEEGIQVMLSKLPKNLHEICKNIMKDWTNIGLELNTDTVNFIKNMREKGYKTYILSNAPLEIPVYLEKIDILKYFDGQIISAEEKLVKPDLKIYELLLNRFSLKPDECLFLDDRFDNIQSAEQCGINGYVFDYNQFNKFLVETKKFFNM